MYILYTLDCAKIYSKKKKLGFFNFQLGIEFKEKKMKERKKEKNFCFTSLRKNCVHNFRILYVSKMKFSPRKKKNRPHLFLGCF